MFDKDDLLAYLTVVIAMAFVVGAGIWATTRESDQEHRDYIAAVKIDMSHLKVGQSIDLQNYRIDLKSGNSNILKVRTFDDNDLLPGNKYIVLAVAAGNTTLMIHDTRSNAYKIIKVHVE
ncbi:hypothetical protein [Ethanoligenens harbinense]|uniref:Uncharacterized protein n=1 Tax=Ethanoligenens harbinense (strain DSM 18485 / JCM 12961 / CGMCC 1.5033 / YUAN-3) TaxID=663278 RepID=E6U5B9_ETHHY|nr:hypothetical protein [Ethanoligenens harbinense]ADU27932.1 hypothetical protein Ethha_2437 [Ethanoligenens harbinense YUAN-3]AVQ96961.1 hypothetical protein CXQ68_12525 [Ethanoligenens harbinense YUAN-3]AYF39621.1 hypothetical protein CXP51_12420 [Ethanoligenens harbinense]AYF42449.1 hypothetical protein CN246_12975 [Ethanoligenens harbinense]QCN93202.1 hypothetical protein DRA42_12570 [Ethanoligenens harbinense]